MGLEVSTYINGLTPSWPVAGDSKSQGDDHIRLIKSVLQNTFPSATGPLYFPKGESTSGGLVLDATDQNNIVMVNTAGGDVAVTLPAGFTSTQIGWSCEVMKVSSDTNAAVVSPSTGSISSQVGATTTIRIGALNQPARFVWTGSFWIAVKPGIPIGQTGNFDGPAPYGFLLLDGSVYSSATYAELFAALGTTTLKDKRGRVEAGVDSGGLRLTSGANGFGTAATAGAVSGGESRTIVTANLPAYTPAGTVSQPTITADKNVPGTNGTINNILPSGGGSLNAPLTNSGSWSATNFSSTTPAFTGTPQGGSSTPFALIQPTIITNKYIRAC